MMNPILAKLPSKTNKIGTARGENSSLTNSNRILKITQIKGELVLEKDLTYCNTFKEKVIGLLNYLTKFWTLKKIDDHTSIVFADLDQNYRKTMDHFLKWLHKLDDLIARYNQMYHEGTEQVRLAILQQEGNVVNRTLDAAVSALIFGRLNEDLALNQFYEDMNYSVQKAIYLATGKAKAECGQKSFHELQGIKEEMHVIDDIRQRMDSFYNDRQHIQQFINQINGIANLFEGNLNLRDTDVFEKVDMLLPNFKILMPLVLDLTRTQQTLILKDKIIEINEKIVDVQIRLAGEVALEPYLLQEIARLCKLLEETTESFEVKASRDQIRHFERLFVEINKNFEGTQRAFRKLNIKTEYNHGGKIGETTFVIEKEIPGYFELNPFEFPLSPEALALKNKVIAIKQEIHSLGERLKLKDELINQLNSLHQADIDARQESVNVHMTKNFDLNRIYDIFQKLIQEINISDGAFDSLAVFALIGSFSNHLNLKNKPGLCTSSIKDFKAVDLTVKELYQQVYNIFKEKKIIKTSFCCENQVRKVNQCDKFKLSEVSDLILDTKICGGLKTSNDGVQQINGDLRTEDIYVTATSCIKDAVDIFYIQKLIRFQLDDKIYMKQMMQYIELVINAANRTKFESLAKELKKLRK